MWKRRFKKHIERWFLGCPQYNDISNFPIFLSNLFTYQLPHIPGLPIIWQLPTHASSETWSQPTCYLMLSTLVHIHDLTETCNWPVTLWLTGKTEYECHSSHPESKFAPLAFGHGWLCHCDFPTTGSNTFLLLGCMFWCSALYCIYQKCYIVVHKPPLRISNE